MLNDPSAEGPERSLREWSQACFNTAGFTRKIARAIALASALASVVAVGRRILWRTLLQLLHRGPSMSISAIQGTFNPYQLNAVSNPLQQQLQQLSQALQSGNLSAAQSDFATLQQSFSQPSATSGATSGAGATSTSTTKPVNQAFNQLASDLQSGNLAAAQKDLSTVQQGIKSQGPISAPFHFSNDPRRGITTNLPVQDLNPTGPSPTSGNLAGAQQAYAALQQELQQFALGSASLSSLSPVSFDA
jgi:hypothetical protein